MNYYAPWIDPRVKLVRAEHLLAYLRKHFWHDEGLVRTYLHCFRHPTKGAGVFLPALTDADDAPVRIFEAVTELARIEDRYAGDVLTDLLTQTPDNAEAKPAMPVHSGKGDALPQPVNR